MGSFGESRRPVLDVAEVLLANLRHPDGAAG
jgi:hypothetical protein